MGEKVHLVGDMVVVRRKHGRGRGTERVDGSLRAIIKSVHDGGPQLTTPPRYIYYIIIIYLRSTILHPNSTKHARLPDTPAKFNHRH